MAPAAFPAPSDLAGAAPALGAVTGAGVAVARIGPNTIIQLAQVLRDRIDEATAARLLFASTGYALGALPGAMIDEREAQAFVRAVMHELGEEPGAELLHEAGRRTADYLMAHRIPRPAQWLMRWLPKRAGLALLLEAMRANAWTFAGSGQFTVARTGAGATLMFHDCAMCRDMVASAPVCAFYAGTFARLIGTLITPRAVVREIECHAQGGHCCRFEVSGIT
jgi:divinyl protochlorophyllide a 8-vinyl-reductase